AKDSLQNRRLARAGGSGCGQILGHFISGLLSPKTDRFDESVIFEDGGLFFLAVAYKAAIQIILGKKDTRRECFSRK
ncbi:MAG TPA: hypothetical protein DHV52_00870, partial [Parachlamydiales bacterium]|nr:hypothetical protein [Parachlamydiales bacterium]